MLSALPQPLPPPEVTSVPAFASIGAVVASSGGPPPRDPCLVLLELVLRSFPFVQQVFSVMGRGYRLVRDLGAGEDKLPGGSYSAQVGFIS